MKIFTLTGDKRLGRSVQRYFNFVLDMEISIIEPLKLRRSLDSANIISLFEDICLKLEHGSDKLERTIVLVDPCLANSADAEPLTYLTDLEPLSDPPKYSQLLAMLILVFPEIHWIFFPASSFAENFSQNSKDNTADFQLIKKFHTWNPDQGEIEDIINAIEISYDPLFDPAGLRNIVKTNIGIKEEKEGIIPLRYSLAAAVDDEKSYAYMHAYTAYRFGSRSYVVTTQRLMEEIFGKENSKTLQNVNLTFEDLFLNFPDRKREQPRIHYFLLEERDKKYEGLRNPAKRVFITVGHQRTDPELIEKNKTYLDLKKSQKPAYKFLFKPHAGIFNLEKDGDIKKQGGFKHPSKNPNPEPKPEGDGHSAPGKLLIIAEKLIKKARQILHSNPHAAESVYGALFALEAQEILAKRTPTTALEALALKHQLEVSAECMFCGVQHNFNVHDRFKELKTDVQALGDWFNPGTRRKSKIDARLGIISALALIFKSYNQFDEENLCLNEIRKLHSRVTLLRNKWNPFYWFFYPLRRYTEMLVGSLTLFLSSVLFWPLLFGYIYYLYTGMPLYDAFIESFAAFFSWGTPSFFHDAGSCVKLIAAFEIIFGFTHLGIFISYLYNLIFRR